jgi:tRNA-splicing ligase RtcB
MQTIPGWRGGRIKAFIDGVEFEHSAQDQVHGLAALKFIHEHIAVMPDVHMGTGASVGTVIPTDGALIPAAVGVDIGCGMMALQTSLMAHDLPDSLAGLRLSIEAAVPHGRSDNGGVNDTGAWGDDVPVRIVNHFGSKDNKSLFARLTKLVEKTPELERSAARAAHQFGTLGGGNHFIEICLDEAGSVWVMLHSGSRGIGNRIGSVFIEKAKKLTGGNLANKDLAWLKDGTQEFADYVEAMLWAQDYARENRNAMMDGVIAVLRAKLPPFTFIREAVNCHHNFAQKENHFGKNVWIARKGAVSAYEGQLGIIPGSMGARSYIVRGKGNADSFCSCSHGAGRRMSRGEAKRVISVEDHVLATEGVECRKDASMLDESPAAYKDIDAVMAAQKDLVEVVAILKQILCVKG